MGFEYVTEDIRSEIIGLVHIIHKVAFHLVQVVLIEYHFQQHQEYKHHHYNHKHGKRKKHVGIGFQEILCRWEKQ